MQRFILLVLLAFTASIAFAQAPGPRSGQPDPNQGPPPPDLKALGLTDAQIEAVKADLEAFGQSNKDRDAGQQNIEDQKRGLVSGDQVDRAAFETALRAGAEIQVQRELARLDLRIKWTAAYGAEKAHELERLFQPPQNQGPNQGPPPRP